MRSLHDSRCFPDIPAEIAAILAETEDLFLLTNRPKNEPVRIFAGAPWFLWTFTRKTEQPNSPLACSLQLRARLLILYRALVHFEVNQRDLNKPQFLGLLNVDVGIGDAHRSAGSWIAALPVVAVGRRGPPTSFNSRSIVENIVVRETNGPCRVGAYCRRIHCEHGAFHADRCAGIYLHSDVTLREHGVGYFQYSIPAKDSGARGALDGDVVQRNLVERNEPARLESAYTE